MHPSSERRAQPQDLTATEVFALFEKEVGIRSERDREDYQDSLRTLASLALANILSIQGDAVRTLEALIAQIDNKLSEQVNVIMHQQEFKRLEATWRGLWYVCSQIKSIEDAKLKFFNMSKSELYRISRSGRESTLYDQVYTQSFATFGGEPFGAIIVDFQFDTSGTDVYILHHLALVGSTAHTAFIVSADPAMFGLTSFTEIHAPRKLQIHPLGPGSAYWRSLCNDERARYLCIALPHILMRGTYGQGKIVATEFSFEEEASRSSDMLWGNPGWAIGDSIARSFGQDGWFAALCGSEAPGVVRNLPVVEVPADDGGTEVIGPTDTPVSYARERELTQLGFTTLLQRKGFSDVVLNAVHNPFRREAISRTAFLGARPPPDTAARFHDDSPDRDLRAVLCASRFAHYIPIVWNTASGRLPDVKSDTETRPYESLELSLQLWFDGYVATPDTAPTVDRPLRSAMVRVHQRDPGDYCAEAVVELWLGYLFVGDVGPVKIAVRLENAFDRPAARQVAVARLSIAEPRRVRGEHLNSQIAPGHSNSQHAIAPFQLYAIEPSREPIQVVSTLTQVLSERAWILQRIVLGPLCVHALVAADLPIDQLIDFAADEESQLEIDITHCVMGTKLNSFQLAFLATYPSKIVRGLSADLAMLDDRYILRLLEPLAVLDPGHLIPTSESRAIECRFDMVILEEPGHDH
ncbi:type VI secretion system contractile sheath large subunit [Paraburkholderia hospita]|uniref:Type VI secretion system contractile sheath large subunit n=1 Tax=Paraburkholderia hospita TaxID=169430 RepID=A0AAN1JKE9_9BURK|nr:type VI secretion system contractile sheath large subunit [Paraburkholderia hospita]AUT75688.1 type VI secretion system contractile sheath large subunit [Paraburkholderia hospita]